MRGSIQGDIQSAAQELIDTTDTENHGTYNRVVFSEIDGNRTAVVPPAQVQQEEICDRIVGLLEANLQYTSATRDRPSRRAGTQEFDASKPQTDDDNSEDKHNTLTVRDVFGDTALCRVVPVLSNLMGHRISRDKLMPVTQDTEANAEVMNENVAAAQSLTRSAWRAAALYAHLLRLPGALGCGLVELQAVSALAALMRRWSQECRGREADLVEGGTSSRSSLANRRRRSNKETSPPKKKSRRQGPRRLTASDYESDDESISLKKENVLVYGFQVANTLSFVPRQKEFHSWSSEAREAIFDALLAGFSTSAALGANIQQISETLRTCINKNTPKPSRHPTSVILLRGMLPALTLKDVVPNGERGKMAVHSAAVDVVEGLIDSASSVVRPGSMIGSKSPRRRRRSSMCRATVSTPNSVASKASRASVLINTPALKSRRSSQHGLTPISDHGYQPRPVLSTLLGLFQKMATAKGLESNNFRKPTVACLQRCLPKLPHEERSHFLRFVVLLSQSKISVHRLISCEIIESVLSQEWLDRDHAQDAMGLNLGDDNDDDHTENGFMLPNALMSALQGRLVDRIAAVRTRAAVSIEKALVHNNNVISFPLLETLRRRVSNDDSAAVRKSAASAMACLLSIQPNWVSDEDINVLCEMTCDPSTNARQEASEGLTTLLEKINEAKVKQNLDDEYDDEGEDSPVDVVARAWTRSVLPVVLDEDPKCAAKGASVVDRIIVEPILTDDADRAPLAWKVLGIIGCLCGQQGVGKGEMQSLNVALKQLATENWERIFTRLLDRVCRVAHDTMPECAGDDVNLHNENDGMRRIGVWCLFEAMVCNEPKGYKGMIATINSLPEGNAFILNAWQAMSRLLSKESESNKTSNSLQVTRGTVRSCLYVMTNLAPGFESHESDQSVERLGIMIQNLAFPTDLVGSAISAYMAANSRENDSSRLLQCVQHCSGWIRESFFHCEKAIVSIFQNLSESERSEMDAEEHQKLTHALVTVGELSMIGFRQDEDEKDKTNHRLSTISQTSLDSNIRTSVGSNDPRQSGMTRMRDSVDTLSTAVAPLQCERPSQVLEELVIAMFANTLPGRPDLSTPETVRTHACAVLGKLCLRDERLAKQSLNLLARELHPSLKNPLPSVQSNALIVLGDLCVRYTNMVDRYLPVMASCLQAGCSDPETNFLSSPNPQSAIVRKHAILLLSSLLLQDYIKWRGLLFHRFLVASADEEESVSELAESVLCGPLKVRFPKLFHNHFVESLFVLNRCTAHPMYITAANTGDGGSGVAVGFDGINLRGVVGEAKRRRIYRLMMSKLCEEEKIGITARLAKEVLGEALSSRGDLGRVCSRQPIANSDVPDPNLESARSVLSDTFYVLTHKSLRVGRGAGSACGVDEDDVIEDPNMTTNNPTRHIHVAKNRLLAKVSRKHLVEIVLPILCNLKTVLQGSRSPMLKDLMKYLLDIYKTYKPEVKEFLANDPNLLQEIEYDARQKQPHQHGKSPARTRD